MDSYIYIYNLFFLLHFLHLYFLSMLTAALLLTNQIANTRPECVTCYIQYKSRCDNSLKLSRLYSAIDYGQNWHFPYRIYYPLPPTPTHLLSPKLILQWKSSSKSWKFTPTYENSGINYNRVKFTQYCNVFSAKDFL